MIERLHYFGATHRTAAIAAREKLAHGPERLPRLLSALGTLAEEAVVLNTCGRFEIYVVSPDAGRWPTAIAPLLGISTQTMDRHMFAMTGRDVARHALRVAAGLDSRLLGEDQILSQIRAAFGLATRHKSSGPLLSALFRSAIHTGRRVRAETALGHRGRSYARLAVSAALNWLEMQFQEAKLLPIGRRPSHMERDNSQGPGRLAGPPVIVVIGTGTLARDVMQELKRVSFARPICVSRHTDRAQALAAEYHGEARGIDELPQLLCRTNVLIACATANAPLITSKMHPMSGPQLLIDLGVPRNIEPDIGGKRGLKLIQLDMLRDADPIQDEAVEVAERMVHEELSRYFGWLAGRSVAPQIVQMLSHANVPLGEAARENRRSLHARIVRLKEEAAA